MLGVNGAASPSILESLCGALEGGTRGRALEHPDRAGSSKIRWAWRSTQSQPFVRATSAKIWPVSRMAAMLRPASPQQASFRNTGSNPKGY
jgi:hypothetical protein